MSSKTVRRVAKIGAFAVAATLAATPLAYADPTPTPQVPQRTTPSPQVPVRSTPTPQVPQSPNRQPTAIPQPVRNIVPGIQQASQPLVPQTRVVYIESQPIVITETEYVDRAVVEEAGGLLILSPDVQARFGAADLFNAANLNYASRTGNDRLVLDQALSAAAAGAVVGGTVGAVGGALVAGVGTGITGGVIGGAAGTVAQIPAQISCGVTNIVAPGLGIPCAVIAAAAGPTTGAAIGAVAGVGVGVGAGAVTGGAAGGAAGAALAASFVPGGVEALQDVAADSVWDLENTARVENGYKPLVGDKPSGAAGNVAPEGSTDTRVTDGTVTGEGVNVEPAAPIEPPFALPDPIGDFERAANQANADFQAFSQQVESNVNAVVNDVQNNVAFVANQANIPSIV